MAVKILLIILLAVAFGVVSVLLAMQRARDRFPTEEEEK